MEKLQKKATKLVPELKDPIYVRQTEKAKLPRVAHPRKHGDMI